MLTQRTDCNSPQTVKYYEGILNRFIWYANTEDWPEDAHSITEWHIRQFLAYVSTSTTRWGLKANGSESSHCQAKYSTVHHYYRVLKIFFNWCTSGGFLKENPSTKIKLANPKPNVIQPYTSQEIGRLLLVCDHDFKQNTKFLATRNKAIIPMLLDTGSRVAELARTRLTDVDTDRGWIKVKGERRYTK